MLISIMFPIVGSIIDIVRCIESGDDENDIFLLNGAVYICINAGNTDDTTVYGKKQKSP